MLRSIGKWVLIVLVLALISNFFTTTVSPGLGGFVFLGGLAAAIWIPRARADAKAALYQRKLSEEELNQNIQIWQNAPLQPITTHKAILKPGESAYALLPGELQEEKTIGYKGGTTGASVRVAKGVTLRTSGTKAMPVTGLVKVAQGELVVTDKRVIFAGDHKSFQVPFDDLISFNVFSDGMSFSDGKKTHVVGAQGGESLARFHVVMNRLIQERR